MEGVSGVTGLKWSYLNLIVVVTVLYYASPSTSFAFSDSAQFGMRLKMTTYMRASENSPNIPLVPSVPASPSTGNRHGSQTLTSEKKTFRRFMEVELWRRPDLENLYPILQSIETACRDINRLMRRVSTDNLDGMRGTVNVQGEDQKTLDIIANRIMKTSLCCSGKVSIVASEEEDQPCLCSAVTDNAAFSGDYAAVFDPLDGSSNVDSGLPTGTIFGVYRTPKYGPKDPIATVKQRGNDLIVAGYCLYSASCHMMITLRTGLHMFTLDDVTGEFYLTRSNIRMPRSGSIYSFNDAHASHWEPGMQYFLQDLKAKRLQGVSEESNAAKKPCSRYMGALVADAQNIILNGGIFGYPGTISKPKGKLRLVYEANPLALIIEEAGGVASNGRGRILDMHVHDIHERTPLFIGSVEEVQALERYNKFYGAK
jgi:fructose-1,6-bisphosphatase I